MTAAEVRGEAADLAMALCDETGRPVSRRTVISEMYARFGVEEPQTRYALRVLTSDRGGFISNGELLWPRLAPPPPVRVVSRRFGHVIVPVEVW